MQVKQIVEITADSFYTSWRGLEITDSNGNEVKINFTDEQIETLAESFAQKVERNKKRQLEKLREQLEEMEDANADS